MYGCIPCSQTQYFLPSPSVVIGKAAKCVVVRDRKIPCKTAMETVVKQRQTFAV